MKRRFMLNRRQLLAAGSAALVTTPLGPRLTQAHRPIGRGSPMRQP